MTIWTPRRVANAGDYRVMCGRIDRRSGRSACPELVASIVAVDGVLQVAAPAWLTDQNSPGAWRISAHAAKLISEGRTVTTKHAQPTLGRTHAALSHIAALPCTMPCPKGHMNRLDAGLLKA